MPCAKAGGDGSGAKHSLLCIAGACNVENRAEADVQSRRCSAKATRTPSIDDFHAKGGMHVCRGYIDTNKKLVIWCTGH